MGFERTLQRGSGIDTGRPRGDFGSRPTAGQISCRSGRTGKKQRERSVLLRRRPPRDESDQKGGGSGQREDDREVVDCEVGERRVHGQPSSVSVTS